jgi:hypothetical protein
LTEDHRKPTVPDAPHDRPEREVTDARLISGLLSVGAALCALAIWLILAEIP